jgi:heat shock protein HslJ
LNQIHVRESEDNRMKRMTLSLLILAFTLAACGSPSSGLGGTTWQLVSYGPADKPNAAAPGVQTSLVFGKDGKVSGTMGCNQFSGSSTTKGDQIAFSAMATTLMACADPAMSQETAVLAMLSGTATYKVDGNQLTITAGDGSVATFQTSK